MGLSMSNEILAKIYVIEPKRVNLFLWIGLQKTGGAKNEGNLHYVIENKCRKNVRNRPFRDVDENTRVKTPLSQYW